ncbi:MAG: alpha/beta fold hydrolase [Actinomycetota bacterium]
MGRTVRVPLAVRFLPQIAYRAWFTPPRPSARARARDADRLKTVQPITVTVDGRERPGFVTGEGPLVILAHGWGGRAAQMLDLAVSAARNGYRAVAIDAPGHNIDPQRTSDGFQMAAGLEALEDRFGPPAALVAHSLGAVTAQIAFAGRRPDSVVWLAPVLDLRAPLQVFSSRARLAPWTTRCLHLRVRRFIGAWWPLLTMGAETDLPGTELLIVHDPSDPDSDFGTSAALAARRSNTRLVEAPGLGHNTLLRDPGVIETVERFLVRARETAADNSRRHDRNAAIR